MWDVWRQKKKNKIEPFCDPQFAAFVPSLHAQSQSGNSLTFISWYPDPSSCKIVVFIQLHFFHGDILDSRKYDTFRGKQAVLFINLLGKGLTQEINGDGGSIWWAPDRGRFTWIHMQHNPWLLTWQAAQLSIFLKKLAFQTNIEMSSSN